MPIEMIKPNQIKSVVGGPGNTGRIGVLYQTQDEVPSRLFYWNGLVHVPFPVMSPLVTVTNAQMLALNATPKTLVAAPGAGLALIPTKLMLYKPAGVAYAGIASGEDLVLKYTNGSGAQCSGVVETTGFLDQATAQTRVVGMPGATGTTAGDYAPVANAPLVLHLLVGEIITGDSPLYARVWYEVLPTVFTA